MAEQKTKPTAESVEAFINHISEAEKRNDCFALLNLMKDVSGSEPKMWGTAMVGFGDHHYEYASGHSGDIFQIGFSPRKQNITLYLSCDIGQYANLLQKLGKYKTGKGCLYIKKLADVDTDVLKNLIKTAFEKGV